MNSVYYENFKIFEFVINMVVIVVKNVLIVLKVCVVCGLKWDEWVVKVDYEVEDSFGEWWIEFWGYR